MPREKTKIVRLGEIGGEGLGFLGFTLRYKRSLFVRSDHYLHLGPRWEGQFTGADAVDTKKVEVAGNQVHFVDIVGAFQDSMGGADLFRASWFNDLANIAIFKACRKSKRAENQLTAACKRLNLRRVL